MLLYSVITCLFFTGVISETDLGDSDTVELLNLNLKPRRKVKQIKPHWASRAGGGFRATGFTNDGSHSGKNSYAAQSYAGYPGNPPWNYGNQQQGQGGNNAGQPGYYPPSGQQGSQSQYPGTNQPGYPDPNFPSQSGSFGGYPQQPQPGYPQPTQPGYPNRPQRPQTGSYQPGQPTGYPQGPQVGYPQRPGPGQFPPNSQTGSFQQPSAPGSQPNYPQGPPDNQVYPGSPFYPQIQPGLTGPPEIPSSELLKYCKAPRGQFGLESSCQKYVDCWDEVAIEQQCPGNLLFNEDKKYCDFPENVECEGRPINETPQPISTNDGNCTSAFATYRSPTNCGEFFVCAHSIPYRFLCPGGLAYNTELGICDYEYRVECNGVPVLPVEETTDNPEYSAEHENAGNEYNQSSNENHYGSTASGGNNPYWRAKLADENLEDDTNEPTK